MNYILKEKYQGSERRRDNSLNDFPTLIQVIINLVYKFGVPAAIAIFLVYTVTKELPVVREKLTNTNQQLSLHGELLRDIKFQNEAFLRMLQKTCSNTAKNDSDRMKCFDK